MACVRVDRKVVQAGKYKDRIEEITFTSSKKQPLEKFKEYLRFEEHRAVPKEKAGWGDIYYTAEKISDNVYKFTVTYPFMD